VYTLILFETYLFVDILVYGSACQHFPWTSSEYLKVLIMFVKKWYAPNVLKEYVFVRSCYNISMYHIYLYVADGCDICLLEIYTTRKGNT